MFDVAHGAGLAAVWGSWARYVMDEKPERFAQFAVDVMGVEESDDVKSTALKGIEAVEEFYRMIEMPTKDMAMKATNHDTQQLGAFKKLSAKDLVEIYKTAK